MQLKIIILFVAFSVTAIAGQGIFSNRCQLPMKKGACKAAIPKWFYDSREGVCKQFLYGGCQGNKNNFVTKEECQRICGKIQVCRGQNEVYLECGSACPRTCESPYPICNMMCQPGCSCKLGYVRDRFNNCIRREKCALEWQYNAGGNRIKKVPMFK